MHRAVVMSLSLVVAACGPGKLPSDPQGEAGSSSTSSSESDSSTTGSSTTDSTTTATTTTSADSNDDTFFPEVDLSTVTPCDPFAQDCPDGEKCVPYSPTGSDYFGANKCVPVTGDQAPGEPCTYDGTAAATDDCDENSACGNVYEVDGELVGYCMAFCMGTPDDPVCPPDYSCTICSGGCPNFCVDSCDPLAQDCNPGLACYWVGNGFNCLPPNNIPAGEPCGFVNDCAPGLVCLTAEVLPACNGSACCGRWCDHGLGDVQCEATPGTVCELFFEQGMAPPGYADLGVCIVPGA
jgi:hypothetical protein